MAMFEEFYSFVRPPFGRDLQVSELFLTESHKEMLARMQYAAERRQFALCTGRREIYHGSTPRFKTELCQVCCALHHRFGSDTTQLLLRSLAPTWPHPQVLPRGCQAPA